MQCQLVKILQTILLANNIELDSKTYDTIVNKTINIQLEEWPLGFRNPLVTLYTFGKTLKEVTKGKISLHENSLRLDQPNNIKKKSIEKSKNLTYNPCILIAKNKINTYYYIKAVYDDIIGVSCNKDIITYYTIDQLREVFLVSDYDYSSLKVFSIIFKK